MSTNTSWRNLELRVADHFRRSGYAASTNQKERGRSGLTHEIDVLAERRDVAGVHRVAVECKAWKTPIEKDVVYKLTEVMRDLGLSKGIIVSQGGLRAGAQVAADQAHIEVWGPDEIRHYLGADALAGTPLALPAEALTVPIAFTAEQAEREIRKARSGFAGLGAEELVGVDLVWIPAVEFRLAVTRLRTGLLKDRAEIVQRWPLYERLTGRLIGAREEPRPFVTAPLVGPALQPQKMAPQVLADLGRLVKKHRVARTDAAQKTRQEVLNAVGLFGSTQGFAVEAETEVFVPFYVGTLARRGSERLIAIHAGVNSRTEQVEQALHEKVDLFRRTVTASKSKQELKLADGSLLAEPTPYEAPGELGEMTTPPSCRCGSAMALRHRKADARPFWGCSTFPQCRQTLPIT